jgi:hypothetical protein
MVMELLGPDMEGLLELLDKRQFSHKTGLMLGIQMCVSPTLRPFGCEQSRP